MGIKFRFIILAAALAIGSMELQAFLVSPASAAAVKTVVVIMTDLPPRYLPETLKITVNTIVEWKNTGNSLHSVHTEANDAQNKNDVHLPPGASPSTPLSSRLARLGNTGSACLVIIPTFVSHMRETEWSGTST
jgi:plastocyanin